MFLHIFIAWWYNVVNTSSLIVLDLESKYGIKISTLKVIMFQGSFLDDND